MSTLLSFTVFGKSSSGPVRVIIAWIYQNVSAKMEIYEPAGQRPIRLWDMGTTKDMGQLPVSKKIADSSVLVRPGGSKLFVLVMKNETQKPIHFFAAPHVIEPAQYSLGFKFKCLCINHVYTILPGEYWYRVVRLTLSPEFVGDAINVTHSLISVEADRIPKEMEKGEMNHEM